MKKLFLLISLSIGSIGAILIENDTEHQVTVRYTAPQGGAGLYTLEPGKSFRRFVSSCSVDAISIPARLFGQLVCVSGVAYLVKQQCEPNCWKQMTRNAQEGQEELLAAFDSALFGE